jgi:hypothetical protein
MKLRRTASLSIKEEQMRIWTPGKKPIWPWWNGLWNGVFLGIAGDFFLRHLLWTENPLTGTVAFYLIGSSCLFLAWVPDMTSQVAQAVRRYHQAAKH